MSLRSSFKSKSYSHLHSSLAAAVVDVEECCCSTGHPSHQWLQCSVLVHCWRCCWLLLLWLLLLVVAMLRVNCSQEVEVVEPCWVVLSYSPQLESPQHMPRGRVPPPQQECAPPTSPPPHQSCWWSTRLPLWWTPLLSPAQHRNHRGLGPGDRTMLVNMSQYITQETPVWQPWLVNNVRFDLIIN